MRNQLRLLFLVLTICFLGSCALQVAPTGGEKDVKPPQVLKAVPENFSTGFHTNEVVLTFDEFIQVKEIGTQLVVSPPLKYPVTTQLRKKKLHLIFGDTLLPNTTYTLNFGNAISDFNEGNVLDSFQYVFSTGDHLDSLFVSGEVENAFDKKPVENALVMLYKERDDSLPYKKAPLYFGKTNKSGMFKIRNISPGRYKIFGIKETIPDYLYNSPEEDVAFTDSSIEAGSENIKLAMFRESGIAQLSRIGSEEPGKVIAVFTQRMDSMSYHFLSDTSALKFYATEWNDKRDTLIFWYRNFLSDSLQLIFNTGPKQDTSTTRLFRFEGKQNPRRRFELKIQTTTADAGKQDLEKDFIIEFNHPLSGISLDSIRLMEDSVPVSRKTFHFSDSLHRKLHLVYPWKENRKYELYIPPGTATDIFGFKNDTTKVSFSSHEKNDYGSLTVRLRNTEYKFPLFFQIINEQEIVYRTSTVGKDSVLVFENLLPKQYRLKVIEDANKNERWDTGNYLKHVLPERVVYYPELVIIRSNWDVDVKWDLKH